MQSLTIHWWTCQLPWKDHMVMRWSWYQLSSWTNTAISVTQNKPCLLLAMFKKLIELWISSAAERNEKQMFWQCLKCGGNSADYLSSLETGKFCLAYLVMIGLRFWICKGHLIEAISAGELTNDLEGTGQYTNHPRRVSLQSMFR